jgi:hypothetical protein
MTAINVAIRTISYRLAHLGIDGADRQFMKVFTDRMIGWPHQING